VSLVTEDWCYRMVTPPKSDYSGVPMSPAGRKLADQWDPAKDEPAGQAGKAYGAAALLRMPGRIRISWAAEKTLKLETDAGTQTRLFYFAEPKSKGGDWQGVSQASWETADPGRGRPMPTGSLKVVTPKLRPGYLRRNGVPYRDKTVVTEYFDRTKEADGESYHHRRRSGLSEAVIYHSHLSPVLTSIRKPIRRTGIPHPVRRVDVCRSASSGLTRDSVPHTLNPKDECTHLLSGGRLADSCPSGGLRM